MIILIVFISFYLPKVSKKITNNIIFRLIILLLIAGISTKEPLCGIVLFFVYAFSLTYKSIPESFNVYRVKDQPWNKDNEPDDNIHKL